MSHHQPGLPVTGCVLGDVLVAGQRVADQDRIRPRGVERAVGLVGDLQVIEPPAGIEKERLVRAEVHHQTRRIVGLVLRVVRTARSRSFARGRCRR